MEIKLKEQQAAQGSQTEPALSDIKRAAVETELKVKAQAEGQFLEEISENAKQDSDDQTEDSNRQEDEGRSERDTVTFSDEGTYYYRLSPEELADLDKMWGKENAELAWKDLLNWEISVAEPISDQLSRLAEIYEKLLADIMGHTIGAVKEQQLSALKQVLSDVLLETLLTRLGKLDGLLRNYGSVAAQTAVKAALYRSVTGVSLSEKELEQFFGSDERASDGSSQNSDSVRNLTENIRLPINDGEEGLEQGVIYERAGKGQIKNSTQYAKRMQEDQGISVWGKKKGTMNRPAEGEWGANAAISPKELNSVYTSKDLELAEDFAQYITRRGNLFISSELSGKSEELYGYLAAIMAIKGQTFSAFSGVDRGLAFELREAVDRMIDFYIQKAWKQSGYINHKTPSFEPKAAYKIYYYIMNQYQTTGNLQEAANKGIRQAYRQFLKKKECRTREEESGSFFTRMRGDMNRDWKTGKQILEKDWREFLAFLGRGDLSNIPVGVLSLSPWGMFAEPERDMQDKAAANPVPIQGVLAGVIILLILLCFFGA